MTTNVQATHTEEIHPSGLAPKTSVQDDFNHDGRNSREYVSVFENRRKKRSPAMTRLASVAPQPPAEGDIVEGAVIGASDSSVFIDIPPFGTGVIYGREFISARDLIKKLRPGDDVAAKVIDAESETGYIELSLKEAKKALVWNEAEELCKAKHPIELVVKNANKGGLIMEWKGIMGFLPVSHLKPEHYPRVEDGSKEQIFEALRKFAGKRLKVSIISVSPEENKLIFSEKESEGLEKQARAMKYSVGDELEREVAGIVDFGVFVKLEEGLEGLVHISEMDWGLVEDPEKMFKVGENVKVKIIDIKDGKISLSIKALKENPWIGAGKKYKKGDLVNGVIIKYNKHGALASIEEGVSGLIHISEFETQERLRENLELGKSYSFVISFFDPKEQRLALSYSQAVSRDESEKGEL